jgi:hypothetical protein
MTTSHHTTRVFSGKRSMNVVFKSLGWGMPSGKSVSKWQFLETSRYMSRAWIFRLAAYQ